METRNEVMISAGKDDYAGRRAGRCAHPNTVRGRVAPRKLEVHSSAFHLLGKIFCKYLRVDFLARCLDSECAS